MVLLTNLPSKNATLMPRDLQKKSSLAFNPFEVSNNVGLPSVEYNTGQYIDALQKIAMQQPLNTKLRDLTQKEQIEGKSLPPQAVTEAEAFAAAQDILGDTTGIWADPDNFENLSKVQLAELEKANPELYKAHVEKYEVGIRGHLATPSFIPDLTGEAEILETERKVGAFGKQMKAEGVPGILRVRERKIRDGNISRISKKNYNLKENDRRALADIVNKMDRHASNPAEESFLTQIADSDSARSTFGGTGGLSDRTTVRENNIELIERDLGITPENRKHFSSVATLALTNFTDIMKKHKHNAQIIGNYLGIDPAEVETDADPIDISTLTDEDIFSSMINTVDPKKSKGMNKEQSLKELAAGIEVRNKQPFLSGMMSTLDKFIRKTMNPNKGISSTPSKTLKGAGSLLRYWTEQGYLQWGRTNKGYIVPIVNSNYGIGSISETELSAAFDPGLRQKRYSTVNAPTYPAVSNITNVNKADWKAYTKSKDIKGKRSTVSQNMLSMRKSTPVRINGNFLFFANNMKKELDQEIQEGTQIDTSRMTAIQKESMTADPRGKSKKEWISSGASLTGGFTHHYASTLGEISQADFDKYVRKDEEAERNPNDGIVRPGAPELIRQHYFTMGDKFEDVNNKFKEQEAGNYKYYPMWYKSDAAGRYFVMDSLFNHINDKGIIRPLLKIGHDVPIGINTPLAKDKKRLLNLAKEVYKPRGLGIFFGENINKKLQALSTNERQLLGFYYALGKTSNKYKIRQYGKTIENPLEAIENGIDSFDAMAEEGAKLRAMLPTKENPEGSMPLYDNMTPTQKSFFGNNKGEWQYPVGLAIDASRFKESLAKGDTEFTFDFTFEEDARQSNAALIATLIGDPRISGLLGLLPELAKKKRDPVTGNMVPAEDLRDLLTATLPETVSAVLNHADDSSRRNALTSYFNAVLDDAGLNGSKVITRGLVVAGLYGKYAGFMYTEAENMLAQTPAHLSILNEAYANNTTEGTEIDHDSMVQDISQIYLALSREHMGNLMGYQDLMKSTGKIIGVLDGTTEIEGVFPGEKVMLAIDELYPVLSDKVVGDEIIKQTEDVGGFTFPMFERQRRAVATSPNVYAQRILKAQREEGGIAPLSGSPETESFNQLGSQIARAFPVNVIQNMDSLAIALAFMVAHGTDKNVPPAATTIHDAIISTADSVLLLNNAYNNIVPHVFAQGGKPFFKQLQNTLHAKTVLPLMRIDDDAKVNLGTEIILNKSGGLKQYSGITSYFDEIFSRTLPGNTFFTPDQLKREATKGNEKLGETNEERFNRMQADDNKFIEIAESLYGYKPPIPENINDRKSYSVTGKQFKSLIMMMLEREGVLTPETYNGYKRYFNFDNVSERKDSYRNFYKGKIYQDIIKNLDDYAKSEWASQSTYNRQLD